ncbi:ATP-binding protein [Nostoc sp. FACHB-892]|uniref:ATP-binding protein n=1 Tax=Nostoc sp. FACHB-892 TaxID=2692843 RepID=UPI001689B227|nr:ATP-binding protein [Nostoc sp. FACHB-892]MBD2731461.1 ATP-binding protein [Nostoc sp. FACHB-892]
MNFQRPFLQELLTKSSTERLDYFHNITVGHLRLRQALDALLINLQQQTDICVLFVVGPAGVGKTTLRLRAEKLLLEEALTSMSHNTCQIPVAGIEAIPAEGGKFNYKDYYLRVLESLEQLSVTLSTTNSKPNFQNHAIASTTYFASKSSDIVRRALEQAMRHHQMTALMVDEAQHLLMLAGGKQMLHQMNWIKSIANITGTVHILFGTYDLLNCCRLSGQVSRRSEDIHLPRYCSDSKEDVTEFIRILQTFQTHLPLIEEPSLVEKYEYILDYSLGCIGILKTWLTRALRTALADNASTLSWKHIQHNEYSSSRREQIQQEAKAGEQRWRNEVGNQIQTQIETLAPEDLSQPPVKRGRVGKRLAKRDTVGINLDVS